MPRKRTTSSSKSSSPRPSSDQKTTSSKAVILDVGHGNCAVVVDREATTVIDAALGGVLLDYLRDHKIECVDTVLISHADADHIAGLIGLLSTENLIVRNVYLNPDAVRTSKIWDDLKSVMKEARVTKKTTIKNALSTTVPGELVMGDVLIQVLAPTPEFAIAGIGGKDLNGQRVSAHSLNAVIRLVYREKLLALFPGDLDEIGLSNIQAEGTEIAADVLVFPHHGGVPGKHPEAFTETLCKMVKPTLIVFSIGRGKHATPRPEVISTIKRVSPGAHIACTQLSERCASKPPGVAGSHLSGEISLGSEKGHCCAGTIVIIPSPVRPILSKHTEFIEIAAPTALCKQVPISDGNRVSKEVPKGGWRRR
jgi:beta-lactamase superfamily II metal-dependent hydrolase